MTPENAPLLKGAGSEPAPLGAVDVLSSTDVLATVCAHCDTLVTTERLVSTCRHLRQAASSDDFYRLVAVLQWGGRFWAEALSRPTRRVFCSMRQELRHLDRFQRCLRRHGFREWREVDFRRLWKAEALRVQLSSLR